MNNSKMITYSADTPNAIVQSKLWVDSFEKFRKQYPYISVDARYMDVLIKGP